MSNRRSHSWASVVANGISDEPKKGLDAKSGQTKFKSKMDNDMKFETPPCENSCEDNTWYWADNDQQTKSHFRRPLRHNWHHYPTPIPHHRHHHRANNPGNICRPRRHHSNSTRGPAQQDCHPRGPAPQNYCPRGPPSQNYNPRGPPPQNWKHHQESAYNNCGEPAKRRASNYYPPMSQRPMSVHMDGHRPVRSRNPHYVDQSSFAYSQNNIDRDNNAQSNCAHLNSDPSYKEDFPERPHRCISPRARVRCQVTFSKSALESIQWQPISKSRQVWEPLDPSQRGSQDPSTPIPPLPPGFEHVVPGKRALCGRTRKLLGEKVVVEAPRNYSTPEPISLPERELREQQHFIAKNDTHLSCRLAQLRVTNGGTGDGYYVRPLGKMMPKLTKMSPQTNEKNQFGQRPKVSYSDLMRRKHELEELIGNNTMDGDCGKPRRYKPKGYFYNNKANKRDQMYFAHFGPTFSNDSNLNMSNANSNRGTNLSRDNFSNSNNEDYNEQGCSKESFTK